MLLSRDGESRSLYTELLNSGSEASYTVPADQPLARGVWNWKARATDEKGTVGDWSETWSFTVETNDPPAPPTLIAPDDNAEVSSTPRFVLKSVDPNGDRVRFLIQVSNGVDTRTYITGFVNSGAETAYTVPLARPLTDGVWTWKARASDETGAESDWSTERRFRVRVEKPDLVPADLSVSPTEVMTGDRVRVRVRVVNQGQGIAGNSRTRARLSRSSTTPLAGDTHLIEFVTPTLDADQSTTHEGEAIIPVDLSPGTYYVWVVVDAESRLVQSNTENDQSSVILRVLPSVRVQIPAGVSPFGLSVATPSVTRRGLRMLTVAVKVWEGASGYRDVGEDEPFQPGRAYWFKASAPLMLRLPGETVKEPAVIHLQPGWNLISSPFSAPVAWRLDSLKVRHNGSEVTLAQAYQNGWTEDYAWVWLQDVSNPYTGYYDLVHDPGYLPGVQTQMNPWRGYWVYAHRECDLVVPPPEQANRSAQRTATSANRGWTLPLTARTDSAVARVLIGVSGTGRGVSIAPPPSPPAGEGAERLEMILERDASAFVVDVRGATVPQQEWALVVRFSAVNEPVHLRWEGANRLPRDLSLMLVDESTGRRRYLRTSAEYRFIPAPGETERRFRLIAQCYIDLPLRIVDLRAGQTRSRQVSIQFSLSRAPSVQAEVLDAKEQRLALMQSGSTRQPGPQVLTWQDTDSGGRALPAGVYLVRVVAYDEEGRQAQAMVPVVLTR